MLLRTWPEREARICYDIVNQRSAGESLLLHGNGLSYHSGTNDPFLYFFLLWKNEIALFLYSYKGSKIRNYCNARLSEIREEFVLEIRASRANFFLVYAPNDIVRYYQLSSLRGFLVGRPREEQRFDLLVTLCFFIDHFVYRSLEVAEKRRERLIISHRQLTKSWYGMLAEGSVRAPRVLPTKKRVALSTRPVFDI